MQDVSSTLNTFMVMVASYYENRDLLIDIAYIMGGAKVRLLIQW